MKNDLNPFIPGQLILLKDSTFAYVMTVEPETRYKGDNERICSCRMGRVYKKGDEIKKGATDIGIIEDERDDIMIVIDMSKIKNFTLSELSRVTARSYGQLTEQKMRNFAKIAGDMYDRNGW